MVLCKENVIKRWPRKPSKIGYNVIMYTQSV